MSRILISIKPAYVDKILCGEKKYEYRKVVARKDISSIIIYETTPIKRVVAEAEILDIIMLPPERLWEETYYSSGISKSFFDVYFSGCDVAYAYKLGLITVFENKKNLSDYGIKCAPQSFVYV